MIKIFRSCLATVVESAEWSQLQRKKFTFRNRYVHITSKADDSCKDGGKQEAKKLDKAECQKETKCPVCDEYQYCPLCPPRGFDYVPPSKCEVFGDVAKKDCPQPCPKPPTCNDPPKPTASCSEQAKGEKKEEKSPPKKEIQCKKPVVEEASKKEEKCKAPKQKKVEKCSTKKQDSAKISCVGGEPKRPPCPPEICPEVPCDCCKVEAKDPAPKPPATPLVCVCQKESIKTSEESKPCSMKFSVAPACEDPPLEAVVEPPELELEDPKPCPSTCSAGWAPKKPIECPRPNEPCPLPKVPVAESKIPMPIICDPPCPVVPKQQTGWPEKSANKKLFDGEIIGAVKCKEKKEKVKCPKPHPQVTHLPPDAVKLSRSKPDGIQKFLWRLICGPKPCPPPVKIMKHPPCAEEAKKCLEMKCVEESKKDKCLKPKGPCDSWCPGDPPSCNDEKGVCKAKPPSPDPCEKSGICKKTDRKGVWRAEKRKIHLAVPPYLAKECGNKPIKCTAKKNTSACKKKKPSQCKAPTKVKSVDLLKIEEEDRNRCKRDSKADLMEYKCECSDECKKLDQCYEEQEDKCCPKRSEHNSCTGVMKGQRPPYENECICYSRNNFFEDLEAATWIERVRRSLPPTRPRGVSCATRPTALCPDPKSYCCPPGPGRPHTDLCPPTEPLVRPKPKWSPPAQRPGPMPMGPPWSRELRNGPPPYC